VVANDFPGFAVCRFPASGNPASSSIKDIGVRRHPAYAGAAVSPDGKRVALSDRPPGPGRSSVDVYSGVDFRHVETIALSDKVFGTDGARYLAFSPSDPSSLWIASRTGMGLWNVAKKEFFWQHTTTIGAMVSHPKRDLTAVDNGDGSIVVVDVEGTIVDAGSVDGRTVSLAFHPKYELLAIGDERGRLLLWDWQGMRSVAAIQLGGQVSGVGFNHDGTILWTIAGGELTMRDVAPDALRELTFQRTNGAMDVDLWNRLTENRPVPAHDSAMRHRD
jgi:WD40 repeat protein